MLQKGGLNACYDQDDRNLKYKSLFKPNQNRKKYREVYEWGKKQLQQIQNKMSKNTDSETTANLIQEQKKITISMLLQICKLIKQECLQKGLIIEEILNHTVKFMNEHQKFYQMITYKQIKQFRDSVSEIEKEFVIKNRLLTQQIESLKEQKNHKWKNIFMLVKDNRVLRRQKTKLLKKMKQEIWKTKHLEEDLISIRSQNLKYKLICEQNSPKFGELKDYVKNSVLLMNLDQKIKKYPGRARRILKQQLEKSETHQLQTLQSKLNFIIQSLEQNHEVCQQLDDWQQNQESSRLCFNVSVQTHIQVQNIGVNTIVPILPAKTYHTYKTQVRYQDIREITQNSKIVELIIYPTNRKIFTNNNRKSHDRKSSFSKFRHHKNSTITHQNRQSIDRFRNQVLTSSKGNNIYNTVNIQVCRPKKITKVIYSSQNSDPTVQLSNVKSKMILAKSSNRGKDFPKDMDKKNKFSTQMYQLYYQPNTNHTNNKDEDPLSGIEPVLYLYQKQLTQKKQRRKGKYNFFKNISNFVMDTSERNHSNQQFECLQSQIEQSGLSAIQAMSNQSKQSITYEFSENLEYKLGNTRKVNQKSNNQKLAIMTSKVNGQIKNKLKTTRHHRQLTQNIQIIRSKQKIGDDDKFTAIKRKLQSSHKQKLKKIQKNVIFEKEYLETGIQYKRSFKKCKTFATERKPQLTEPKQQQEQKKSMQILNQDKKLKDFQDKIFIKDEHLINKLLSAIYMKRKQTIQIPKSLRAFCHISLIDQFQNKNPNYVSKARLQLKFYNAIKSVTIRQNEKILIGNLLQNLLSHSRCQIFAEDMFVLFSKMLDKLNALGVLNNFQNIQYIPIQYGLKALQYLCSIFLSQKQTSDFLKQLRKKEEKSKIINMIECFIKLQLHLEKIVFDSQIWQFWSSASRWSVQNTTQNQIRQMLKIYSLISVKNQLHFERISHYALKSFPLHRLCLYAHRFQWKEVYYINSWIQSKYTDYFWHYHLTPSQINQLFISIKKELSHHKLYYLLQICQNMQIKYKSFQNTSVSNFIKFARLTITFSQIQKLQIFPCNLQKIHKAYRKKIKNFALEEYSN